MAAKRIEITRDGTEVSVVVDGVEIPAYAIVDGPAHPTTSLTQFELPSVTLTLAAHHLSMDNKHAVQEVRGD